jgi:CBS domain-containing protein
MTETYVQPALSPPVAEIMQPAVTTVELDAHVAAAVYRMKHAGATAVVVVDDEESKTALGIITETDIVRLVADGQDVNEVRIRDLMTVHPTVCHETTTLHDAARSMLDGKFRHLPVVDDGKVVGMVDINDVSRALLGSAATGSAH